MVFELELESATRRPMFLAFVEDMANVSSEWHEPQQMLAKQALAFFGGTLRKDVTRGGQSNSTFFEFGKFQDVQRLGNRKQVVAVEDKSAGNLSQIGMPAMGRGCQGFNKPSDVICRHRRQNLHQAPMDLALQAKRFCRPQRQDRIDFVDGGAERSIEPVTRLWQGDAYLGRYPSGIGR